MYVLRTPRQSAQGDQSMSLRPHDDFAQCELPSRDLASPHALKVTPKLLVALDQAREHLAIDDHSTVRFPHRWPRVATAENTFHVWPNRLAYDAAVLGMSGFSASGYKMQRFAPYLAKTAEVPVFATALPGHTGRISDLTHITSQEMIDATVASAQALRRRFSFAHVVGLGHSTAGLAMIAAHSQHQQRGEKLFDAIIMTAPPLSYFDKSSERKIRVIHKVYRAASLAPQRFFDAHKHLRARTVPFPSRIRSHADRRSPAMSRMPLNAFYCLEELRVRALGALPSLNIPMLYIQGRHDDVAHPVQSLEIFLRNAPRTSPHRVHIYDECGHSTMYEEQPRRDRRGLGSRLLVDIHTFVRSVNLTPLSPRSPSAR